MMRPLLTSKRRLLLLLTLAVCFCGWQLVELTTFCLDFAAVSSTNTDAISNTILTPSSSTLVHHTQHSDNVLKQDELQHWGVRTYFPNRILCAVPTTSWRNHNSAHKIQRLQQTWGPLCDKLVFVLASQELQQLQPQPFTNNMTNNNILVVNMTRSANPKERNIWNKVHIMWSRISDLYINDYEWFLKVDDDTFLFVHHLRKFLQYYNPNIPRYMGHATLFRWKYDNIVFNAGLAYVLSREALIRVSPKLKTMPIGKIDGPRDLCHDEGGSGDDTSIAVCLQELGIWPENTLDAQQRQRFLPFQLHAHYTHKRDDEESWFWKYKPNNMGAVEENCCVPNGQVIAAHGYLNGQQDDLRFYQLHQMALATQNYTPPIPPKPMLFQYEPTLLDFEIDDYRNSKSAHAWRPKFTGYNDLTTMKNHNNKHHESNLQSKDNDDDGHNEILQEIKQQQQQQQHENFKDGGLSLAVLTHASLVIPAVHVFRNMLQAFTTGRDATNFTEVIVYYDGRQAGPKLDTFLKDFGKLLANHTIHKLVKVKFEESVHHAVGALDPNFEDAAMYAIYQYLTGDCVTQYCAFMTNDVFAHDGGGLQHAIVALQQRPDAIFGVPPLGYEMADFTNGTKLQQKYPDADGNFPYMHPVGLLPPLSTTTNTTCQGDAVVAPVSTRYFVADPERFRKVLPLKPETKIYLEQHSGLYGKVFSLKCKDTGYIIHPPPWHMGNRLFETCGIEALQQAVNHPEGLALDTYNNMIEQSWTEACKKYKNMK